MGMHAWLHAFLEGVCMYILYVWAYMCACMRACVCMHMLAPMCMHDFCVCVVSFPGVQKCGEEEEELRKELEEWRSDLNGKVMWSVVF